MVETLLPQSECFESEIQDLKESLHVAEEQREQAERCVEEFHEEIIKNEELFQQLEEAASTRDQAERVAEQLLERIMELEASA